MKLSKFFFVVPVIVFFSLAAWAACPIHPNPGVYETTAGTINPGRVSESWCTLPSPGVPGNTQNAMSWDGANLGAQWKVWGMAINPAGPQIAGQNMVGGNGWIAYSTDYVGGQFWLSKSHAWSDGVNDLTGQVFNYNVYSRVTYVGGVPVAVYSTAYFTGVFDNCALCTLEYVISNVAQVWPAQTVYYPPFLCGATAGEYYDVCCIKASVYCPVGNEESTWGTIKSLYK
jgi:hypothetical protein